MRIQVKEYTLNIYRTAQKRNGFWYVRINQFYRYHALTIFGLAISILKESAIQ
jgi:hypothetical protein